MNTKAYATAVLAILLTGGPAALHAQNYFPELSRSRDVDIVKAEKNYLGCLDSPSDGVVESALAHVAMLRIALPASSLPALEQKVADLSQIGRTPTIRYKAYLVSAVFESPSMFAAAATVAYADDNQLFAVLASTVQARFLGAR